jgi:3-deoxy-D-manno-octulosonic acid kinase
MILRLPPGYRRVESRTPLAVAHDRVHAAVSTILQSSTLYDWARLHPERREYRGRGPVYSAPLPEVGARVVVRHAFRGGVMAPLLRDLYLPPTPAPVELAIAHVLTRAGVPTPPVMAFATYRAAFTLRRVDVMTMELAGEDLGTALRRAESADARRALVAPVAHLIALLSHVGAWHQDLNVKNILLVPAPGGPIQGVVLDVDRVRFAPAGDPHIENANMQRLRRSIAKQHRLHGITGFDDADFAEMARIVRQDQTARAADREIALQEYMP